MSSTPPDVPETTTRPHTAPISHTPITSSKENSKNSGNSQVNTLNHKKSTQDLRMEIRNYIRNERDTVLKKWMALKENIKSEDKHREEFYNKKYLEDTKSLPMNILKFIGTLKKAVRNTMRYKGGTPYSIVRSLFIYWDADKSGLISADELLSCLKSLGVKISAEECREIVSYYSPKNDAKSYSIALSHQSGSSNRIKEMDYHQLLHDIQMGEPSLIAFVTQSEDEEKDNNELRFEEINDRYVRMPATVKRFLEAVRNHLNITMRTQGGTPYQHIRHLFQFFDYDYSNGLDAKELVIASRRKMKLELTEEHAKIIVGYYDRKGTGQISYEKFLADVCADVKPILAFNELTPLEIEEAKKSLESNPFIRKQFYSAPNKILEQFKLELKASLVSKVTRFGGSITSWIREAFVNWDRNFTGKITHPEQLIGAVKRLGVTLTEPAAKTIMACYDPHKQGEMQYNYLIEEITKEDSHFLKYDNNETLYSTIRLQSRENVRDAHQATLNIFSPNNVNTKEAQALALKKMNTFQETTNNLTKEKTPYSVRTVLEALRSSCYRLANRLNKGEDGVDPRDLLHGTFLRFDSSRSGRITAKEFVNVLAALRVKIEIEGIKDEVKLPDTPEFYIVDTIKWFDTDGSNLLDYNNLVSQLFGSDITTEPLKIPKRERPLAAKHIQQAQLAARTSGINPNYLSMTASIPLRESNEFTVSQSTMEKNLEVIESTAVKLARSKQRKQKILAERAKIEKRIALIDEQKTRILEEYKLKKSSANEFPRKSQKKKLKTPEETL